MLPVQRVRRLLSDHIGQQLTPELATAIELSAMTQRDKVDRLAETLVTLPQSNCQLDHFFTKGACVRKLTLRAGEVIVGAEHRKENLVLVAKGVVRAVVENGYRDIHPGEVHKCLPGTKNAFVALEDAAWFNVLVTDTTDVDELVREFSTVEPDELVGGARNKQLLANAQLELEF